MPAKILPHRLTRLITLALTDMRAACIRLCSSPQNAILRCANSRVVGTAAHEIGVSSARLTV